MLIKSFEGFRPRAIQRAEGGWIIGYGHTLSAREGASVSEADAELLLRYDLLPVEKTVNEAVPGDLNQHQFDALVSFAFSVGVADFAGSDVRQRLNAGAPGEAADAIMGWPEPVLPETALRRRAAERALFVANPGAPVALSDLLSAPLLPPAVVISFAKPQIESIVEAEAPTPVDPRGAAVAALLGEPPARIVRDETTSDPTPETPTASNEVEPLAPSNDNPPVADALARETAPPAEVEPLLAADIEIAAEPVEPNDEPVAENPVVEASPEADASAAPAPATDPAAGWQATRYAPYGLAMAGPLPYLQAAQPKDESATTEAPSIAHSVVETPLSPIETPASPEVEPITASETDTVVDTTQHAPVALTPVEPMVYVAPVDAAPAAELILTPPEDAPEPALARPLWTPEQRDEPDGSEANLFGEDLTLTLGGSVMRHEMELEAPAKFDWKETAPFIFMGGVGLVSFGASMAAFRRAAEQSGGGELTIIGWVLALIGPACVGVSSVNLYRKFGLPGGD